MKKIDGTPKSVHELLSGIRYTIHYYQREYQWQTKQIEELIDDLTEEFSENYTEGDERIAIKQYGHYFMGSIVLTADDNAIIDGQQRLTTITLILIYLYRKLQSEDEKAGVMQLIYSLKLGEKTFNINTPEMPERAKVMDALLHSKNYDISESVETVRNIFNRYCDIENLLNDILDERSLPFFKDWLLFNVDFIRIVAQTEQDAHKIFVSMNDRGLSLTPTEMLKGYLLSKIEKDDVRLQANETWKSRILMLKGLGKEEESDFIKYWIRSHYADTIRDRKKSATPGDYDKIGTAFHKWVKENNEKIDLSKSTDYEDFVLEKFTKLSSIYLRLKDYSRQLTPGYEYVFYNANRNFTLQYQLILAGIDPVDHIDIVDQKIKLISCFLDLYFTRRIFNYKTVDYSAILYNVFLLSKKIRMRPIDELRKLLKNEIEEMEFQFNKISEFRLTGWTVRYMLHILARITEYIEVNSGMTSNFANYVNREIKNPYDIEHIICNHFDMYELEFSDEEEFEKYRNLFGGLLILPMDINRSLSDSEYDKKLKVYYGTNILAKSLHESCYINNPNFKKFCELKNLSFAAIPKFSKNALLERQKLYEQLVKAVWDVNILDTL